MDTSSCKELGFPEYWNKRYDESISGGGESSHEWFRAFEKLRPFLEKELPAPSLKPRILHLGCGDSVRKPPSKLCYLTARVRADKILRP